MRPVHLFYHLQAKEWGQIAYQFVYKALPIYILYLLLFSLRLPTQADVYLWTAAALVFAAYINICINYLIGVAALWTTESRWFFWVNHAFTMLLSGFFIPVEWLPDWLHGISSFTPYPYLLYYPTKIYMQMERFPVLLGSAAWCVGLTAVCLYATYVMRKKVEVQGG